MKKEWKTPNIVKLKVSMTLAKSQPNNTEVVTCLNYHKNGTRTLSCS